MNLPRAWSRLPRLPQRRAADALLPVLELLLLLHADVPRAGLPVLHHGGLHHGHGGRVPSISEEAKGTVHPGSLCVVIHRGTLLYISSKSEL